MDIGTDCKLTAYISDAKKLHLNPRIKSLLYFFNNLIIYDKPCFNQMKTWIFLEDCVTFEIAHIHVRVVIWNKI